MCNRLHRPRLLLFLCIIFLIVIVVQQYLYFSRRTDHVMTFAWNEHNSGDNCNEKNKFFTAKVRQLTDTIAGLTKQIDAMIKQSSSAQLKSAPFSRAIPATRTLSRDVDIGKTFGAFQNNVTILIYGGANSGACIADQIKVIRIILPTANIIVAHKSKLSIPNEISTNITFLSSSTASSEGKALNALIASTKTPYFLYLSQGAIISDYKLSNSPYWLYNALEVIPELDFVGSSILRYNSSLKYAQMDIHCHRLKMCYWTLRQTYEYQYSVSDVMICEETSISFMGRTSSVAKVGRFDESLTDMTTTDFFYRAKGKAVSGLMPEVFLHVSKQCTLPTPTPQQDALHKQPFMDKYSLKRIEDSFGRITNYPIGRSATRKSVLPSFSYVIQGGVNIPQATESLTYSLKLFDDFFNSKNITYMIVAGVALGGIKTRDVLPWDTGDVDTGYFGVTWQKVLADIRTYIKTHDIDMSFSTAPFSDGPPSVQSISAVTSPSFRVHNDIYSREYLPNQGPEKFMYIFTHDRYIPVHRNLFEYFRDIDVYGMNYLQMQNGRGNLHCTVKGHHACLPEEFVHGGGHWRDFYCH